jgi:hypothetical protein
MGITLDASALNVYQKSLERHEHPLRPTIATWTRKNITLSSPSVAWAEYWRGRGANEHYVAKLSSQIRVECVPQRIAELAAEGLRNQSPRSNRNSVEHLIDAIVMAHAHDAYDAVYTTDIDDFVLLWNHFTQVKALVDANTGQIVRKR